MLRPTVTQDGRNATQRHVGGLALRPALQRGLQIVAVGAGVPEEVDDLDLPGGLDRLGLDQPVLDVLPRAYLLRRRGGGEAREREQRDEAGAASPRHGLFPGAL